MRAILFLALLLFSFENLSAGTDAALQRSNGLLRFIGQHQALQNRGLQSLINTRCSRYLPSRERSPCKKAVKELIKTLDYHVIFLDGFSEADSSWNPRSFVFVAFKTRLLRLLNSEKTTSYLQKINEELYAYLADENKKVNIWDVTKSFYKTDYYTAQAIAALFQDTSLMKLHLAYLERARVRGNIHFAANKELLERVIDTINLILDSSEEHYRKLFYPEDIQKDLNRNIYHFYVPLFLSMELKRIGFDAHTAFTGGFMLNLTYEFVTSSGDYRFLYHDPKTIESTHKVKDIFGGYCGSKIAVDGRKYYKKFSVIQEGFKSSTRSTVQFLLAR